MQPKFIVYKLKFKEIYKPSIYLLNNKQSYMYDVWKMLSINNVEIGDRSTD